jgi:hypothetical protein
VSPVRIERIKPKKDIFGRALKRFDREMEQGLDESAEETLTLYEKTVRTWTTQVRFIVRKTKLGRSVYTLSRTYRYVDRGTKPHIIAPRRAKVLRFSSRYKAKTKPRVITSTAGGASGAAVFTPKPVRHPGTEPRDFTLTIHERMRKKHAKNMRKRMKELFK